MVEDLAIKVRVLHFAEDQDQHAALQVLSYHIHINRINETYFIDKIMIRVVYSVEL
jgi:hypothetical protein